MDVLLFAQDTAREHRLQREPRRVARMRLSEGIAGAKMPGKEVAVSLPITETNVPLPSAPPPVLPLESGDCMSRAEFERRYLAMPHIKKAELIEGMVHMPSPVRLNKHATPHLRLACWLGTYDAHTEGVQSADNATVRLDMENELQPDGLLFIDPARGGKVRITSDDYIEGAPELVAEISASTASIDLHSKLRVYRRNGVQEYIVWRVLEQAIDWFRLVGGEYERLPVDAAGWLRSQVFPGLWLDAAALLRDDMAAVLAVLGQGLASQEHAAFMATLQRAP
jgi:Uma2 family endonuclease